VADEPKLEHRMLIERLTITGHPAIGNIELDFRDETGAPALTVVIAGENGVGKTIALEAIHSLFDQNARPTARVDAYLQIDAEEARRIAASRAFGAPETFSDDTRHVHVTRHGPMTLSAIVEGFAGSSPFGIDNGPTGWALRSFYSNANVSYPTSNLQRIEPDALDRANLPSLTAGNVQGVQIPQLLLALRHADLEERQTFEEEHPGAPVPPGLGSLRFQRFRDAFALMFPTKRLKRIAQETGTFQVIFEQHGVETNIHQLSTGEQQIVLRAGFFIRDASVMQGAIILIDEPELSLSPEWQSKILNFYAKVLQVEDRRHPQVICATHSPFIVHSASAGKVIVLRRDADDRVRPMPKAAFETIGPSVAVQAFNLDRFIRETQPETLRACQEIKAILFC